MKIAVISDIHSNALALEAVLNDVHSQGVTQLLIAGDFIGYYYRPDEVFELLKPWSWQGIQGNHDFILSYFISGDKDAMKKYRDSFGSSLDVAVSKLSRNQKKMLASLPSNREMTILERRIFLAHGSPWSQDERIYPDASPEVFKRIGELGYDFVFLGHTHYPFIKEIGKTKIVNPGSVGQPRDESANASWALVDLRKQEVKIRRVRFDPSEVIKDIEIHDPHNYYLREVLTRNSHAK